MPLIGLGTFSPDMTIRDKVKEATKTGLDIGYRHVDSAYFYLTEESIGKAFREKFSDGDIKREDVFHTTKLWGTFHQPHLVRPALERSLASLQLNYVDLFIIHFPISLQPGDDLFPVDENGVSLVDDVDLRQTWEAMEQCKDAGLVKSIGVSNFNRQQLEMILNKADLKYKPVCNQVECHPYLTQEPMLEFCNANNIVLAAYGVLGSPTGTKWVDSNCPALLQDPVLTLIGEKYNKSPAQVSIRYIIQRGCVPIVKSFNPDHMRQNLQVFDFHLSSEDMDVIAKLNRNMRYWKFTIWRPKSWGPGFQSKSSRETWTGLGTRQTKGASATLRPESWRTLIREHRGKLNDKGLMKIAEAWFRTAKALHKEGWTEEIVKRNDEIMYVYNKADNVSEPPPYDSGDWTENYSKPRPSSNAPSSVAPPSQVIMTSTGPGGLTTPTPLTRSGGGHLGIPSQLPGSPAPTTSGGGHLGIPFMSLPAQPSVLPPPSGGGHFGAPSQSASGRPIKPMYPVLPVLNPNGSYHTAVFPNLLMGDA
ncbi:PREDICTED: aldo-keto reductase family 1 member C1 homolog [Nanorana parkeri]|uniref:aldo-keto reductase family 1 member C1 homolog n=1 Tax=Nanorana parkeri TaxID=125878 RepID=UPI000854A734|nr:PREDICTED: aldo-keto reductase family 1 member C1 homolog [Nanorana parkeri]